MCTAIKLVTSIAITDAAAKWSETRINTGKDLPNIARNSKTKKMVAKMQVTSGY